MKRTKLFLTKDLSVDRWTFHCSFYLLRLYIPRIWGRLFLLPPFFQVPHTALLSRATSDGTFYTHSTKARYVCDHIHKKHGTNIMTPTSTYVFEQWSDTYFFKQCFTCSPLVYTAKDMQHLFLLYFLRK